MKTKTKHIIHIVVFELAAIILLMTLAAYFQDNILICVSLLMVCWLQLILCIFYHKSLDTKSVNDFENDTDIQVDKALKFTPGTIICKNGKHIKIEEVTKDDGNERRTKK